jgi:type II secretory pathway pseudopilin PulG
MNETRISDTAQALASVREDESGFTLIEALGAIVILVFGLIAIANLMLVASTSNTIGNQSTAATAEATQQLEVLKATPFTNIVAGGDVDNCVGGFCNVNNVPGVGDVETRWLIVPLCPGSEAYFIRVRSEGRGVLARARSRAEFTTIRTCTDGNLGCPAFAGVCAP